VIGGGIAQLDDLLLHGPMAVTVLIAFVAARFVLGPASYAAQTPGGLFAPILLVGASLGALAGIGVHGMVPWLDSRIFMLAGMVAFFTATVRSPVTGLVLIVEMTGVTSVLVPMLVAACGAFAAATAVGSEPIYDALRSQKTRLEALDQVFSSAAR
jgi:CIC family chloride channel protein